MRTEIVMTAPERLRFARERAGIDQVEMSRITGVSRAAISRYENGGNEPKLTALVRWARATDVSLDWLCARDLEYAPRDSNPEPTDYGFDEALAFWSIVEPAELVR